MWKRRENIDFLMHSMISNDGQIIPSVSVFVNPALHVTNFMPLFAVYSCKKTLLTTGHS